MSLESGRYSFGYLCGDCNIKILALDKSAEALTVAKYNAEQYQLNNIQFYQSDWFSNIEKQQFDLIVSNPPYIAEDNEHLSQGVVRFEPKTALIADNKGLKNIQIIANNARDYLSTGGHLLVEHGYNQENNVQTIFKTAHYQNVQIYPDLSVQERVTCGKL